MIRDKKSLKEYLLEDWDFNAFTKKDYIKNFFWKGKLAYLRNLRKLEYHINCHHKIRDAIRKLYHLALSKKLHLEFFPNNFGPGLRLEHPSCIIINPNVRVGSHCNIHQFVTIGNKGFDHDVPTIGDNCFIGANSVIIGNISIGNNVVIGAGSVVTHSFGDNVVIAGNPAKIIKNKE